MRDRRLLLFVLAGAGLAALTLVAWAALSPEGFPGFFWKHFAGPVAAQAEGRSVTWNGIPAQVGYSVPSLLGYGAILLLGLYAVDALLLRRLGLRLGWGLAVALAPFFAFGPLLRALQVTGFLTARDGTPLPLAYAVVEPVVYLTTAALAALALGWGATVARMRLPERARTTVSAGSILALGFGLWLLLLLGGAPYVPSAWGLLALLAGAIAAAFLFGRLLKDPGAGLSLGLGLAVLAPFVLATIAFLASPDAEPWPTRRGAGADGYGWILPLVLAAAAVAGLLTMALGRAVRAALPRLAPLARPEAGLLVFAHAVDGFSTILGVKDPFNWGLPQYQEQNPVSLALLNVANGWGFVVVKLLVGAVTALVLHEFLKEEEGETGRGRETLVALGYVAVFALGWGPGFTNLLRAGFGV
ncbi:MAG TPA: DUF63 family protein [Candidatus Thermoplasmatota archaeon]|nr:DUF63 family protein [Candidatus Thermoplasmatota archaeon]